MPYADFCSAVRLPLSRLSRRSDTEQISWGKLSHFPCTIAESTLRTLMDYGLRGTLPTRPVRAPSIRFLSIDAHVFLCFLRTRLAAIALASSLGLHLHRVGQRTFTSKLLSASPT